MGKINNGARDYRPEPSGGEHSQVGVKGVPCPSHPEKKSINRVVDKQMTGDPQEITKRDISF